MKELTGHVKITKEEYYNLLYDSARYSYLEGAGVDNWCGYDDAYTPDGEDSLSMHMKLIKREIMQDDSADPPSVTILHIACSKSNSVREAKIVVSVDGKQIEPIIRYLIQQDSDAPQIHDKIMPTMMHLAESLGGRVYTSREHMSPEEFDKI